MSDEQKAEPQVVDLTTGQVEFQSDKKREFLIVRYRGEGTMRVDLMNRNEVRLFISPEEEQPEDTDDGQ